MISKNQFHRLALIDHAIKTLDRPSKEHIRWFVQERLDNAVVDDKICNSTIEKDMYLLRNTFSAPIKYQKAQFGQWHHGWYYYDDPNYLFWKGFLAYWSLYVDFPQPLYQFLYDE